MKKVTLILMAMLFSLLAVYSACAEFDISQSGLIVSGEAQQLGKPESYGS